MNVFDLDQKILADYRDFSRSFTAIRAADLREQVDAIYERGQFWPDPLVTINPSFEAGPSVDRLAAEGGLHPDAARVFRADGAGLSLHRHQVQALAKAAARRSFVVTTGTGSGKSLCFFLPIIDAAVRARAAGEPARTRAIVVYPMNALANSQMEELGKFLKQSGLPPDRLPSFARYTGQESQDEREAIRQRKPDILLTNFMMLELLMTRQNELDRAVIGNAKGLEFLVLDELHTYRGRQGADVAMLVRRVRDRLCPHRPPICIGTSATMATDDDDASRLRTVAAVASRLFAVAIDPTDVIEESLRRATDLVLKSTALGEALVSAIDSDLPDVLTDDELRQHPIAVWIELEMGLEDGLRLKRRRPITLAEAAGRLAELTGRPAERCRAQLQAMLMMMSRPAEQRGGVGDRAFMAFKLHRFLSGAGQLYATLRPPGARLATVEGQQFHPDDPAARLFPTVCCRACGQEYHPAALVSMDDGLTAVPRPPTRSPPTATRTVRSTVTCALTARTLASPGPSRIIPRNGRRRGRPARACEASGASCRRSASASTPPALSRRRAVQLGSSQASSASALPARTSHRPKRDRSTGSRACPARGGVRRPRSSSPACCAG